MSALGFFGSTMAATVRARREIVAHLFVHHAVSAGEAVPYVPGSPIAGGELRRLQDRRVVHEAGRGRFWIDPAALKADAERRRRRLVPLVIAVALILAAIPLFFYDNSAERGFLSQAAGAGR